LNHIEVSQIATKELEAMIKKISNPEFFTLAAKNADFVYFQKKLYFNS